MPTAIHWDWEGHSASKPLQNSCTETLLAPRSALRAAARAVQIFAVFIFEYGASIRNIRKFAPFENFPLYGIMDWITSCAGVSLGLRLMGMLHTGV